MAPAWSSVQALMMQGLGLHEEVWGWCPPSILSRTSRGLTGWSILEEASRQWSTDEQLENSLALPR
jgi:hypothetical protein